MKLDVLVTTAHPDDAEFAMGGTILKLVSQGKSVGICDFTAGELGTRGNAEIRAEEAAEADKRMGIAVRVNLGFKDGFIAQDEAHKRAVIEVIRRFQPEIIFANPLEDRHPDHGVAGKLTNDAVFLSGLPKIVTQGHEAWRPKRLFHYIMGTPHKPDFIVDVTPFWDKKRHVLCAYESQFKSEKYAHQPETVLTRDGFWEYLEGRDRILGSLLGATYAEGFLAPQALKIDDIMGLCA